MFFDDLRFAIRWFFNEHRRTSRLFPLKFEEFCHLILWNVGYWRRIDLRIIFFFNQAELENFFICQNSSVLRFSLNWWILLAIVFNGVSLIWPYSFVSKHFPSIGFSLIRWIKKFCWKLLNSHFLSLIKNHVFASFFLSLTMSESLFHRFFLFCSVQIRKWSIELCFEVPIPKGLITSDSCSSKKLKKERFV